MWDLPGPGLKSVSPALAGRFLTTEPPGKSQHKLFLKDTLFVSVTPFLAFIFEDNQEMSFYVDSSTFGRKKCVKKISQDFRGGAVVENPPANAGNMGLSPGLGRSHMPRSN